MAKTKKHAATAQKLGQHFLYDHNLLQRIADSVPLSAQDNVLEIGAGVGTLTAELAQKAGRVVAIEIDAQLLPKLKANTAQYANVTLIHGDALRVDLAEIQQTVFQGEPFSVVANLPYYITTPLLLHLLRSALPIRALAVVIQQEAAERFLAQVGEAQYCAVAAEIGYYAQGEIAFLLPRTAFVPPPQVDSACLCLHPWAEKPVHPRNEETFLRVLRAAFAMRRKTMANNLITGFSLSGEEARAILQQAGLPPQVRGEALSLQQYADISDVMAQKKESE